MSQPDRADRYMETQPGIPITRPPSNPGKAVKGHPTSAPRPKTTMNNEGGAA